ncbi:MAG: DUF1538 domain-containing protein [Firmicutes bacterium]|nr:DUF1538 domain-containing protein [Bacillota bacterium]
MFEVFKENLKESFLTIMPIVIITLILKIFIPIPSYLLISFLISSVLLILGTAIFTVGAELSMETIGEKIGNKLVNSKKVWIILIVSFIIGTVVTIAEPDLKVLADQLTSMPNFIMILTISIGVGISLLLSSVRSIYGWDLNKMLLIGYIITLVLMFFVKQEFIPVAFDSGGITTGTISIPFIVTLGIGLTANRTDKKAKESSFGLVSLCSIGPIIAMLILGMFYPSSGSYEMNLIKENISITNYITQSLISIKDVVISLCPILIVFIIFQLFTKDSTKYELRKITVGVIIILIGLTLFFTAANVGFIDMGYYLGEYLAETNKSLLIIFSIVISCFICIAEPAVQMLNEQVENITDGTISKKTMNISLAIGCAVATGLSILRIITSTSFILYILIFQIISLILMFFTPKIFTAIAFDAGGATGGTLTAAFLLPISIGTCIATNTDILTGAFGLAAFISIAPLISVQIVGIIYKFKTRNITAIYDIDDSIVDFDLEVLYE